jgi:TatD DNase family protein
MEMKSSYLVDSHCHLNFQDFNDDFEKVLIRAEESNVKIMVSISTELDEIDKIIKISEKYSNIYCTVGVHPHSTNIKNQFDEVFLEEKSQNSNVIGIGETGLDFYYENSKKDDQIKSFETHIEASIELKYPLIVHSRSAERETFDILNKYKNSDIKILMHCFTGSKEFAKKMMTLNAYFSASGIITFKNSTDLQETFKMIENDKILIETDSPFLAPTPMRGKKNEPSFIKYTLEKLSELKSKNFDELETITNDNFERLFFQ